MGGQFSLPVEDSNASEEVKNENDEFAKVDPFNDEERNDIFQNENYYNHSDKFQSFQKRYEAFYQRRKLMNDKLINTEVNNNASKLRSEIKILIIASSEFKNTHARVETDKEDKFYLDAADLSMAFLIRHLAHNCLCIPYDQILITSSCLNKFKYTNFVIEDFEKEIPDDVLSHMTFSYDSEDFFLSQSVNLAQIENKQIKFFVENSDKKIIFPFNFNVIKYKLNPTKETKLFVFF